MIGTPIRKGISGGQKRRVSVASQLITGPKILFLDELTSGLDSVASYEVVSCVRQLGRKNNLVVIASIHQPSTSTFQLFDSLLLLSNGKTCYQGPLDGVAGFFESAGYPMPVHINPAEFLLDAVNIDFAPDREAARHKLAQLQAQWADAASFQLGDEDSRPWHSLDRPLGRSAERRTYTMPLVLLQRLFIKSYRDVIAYGIRLAMYTGLAIMMGTVWLRLDNDQASIQPFINAIFFGGAFMSFMAVAGIPSVLESRALFVKERENGVSHLTKPILAYFYTKQSTVIWAFELPRGRFPNRPPVSLHIRSRVLGDCILVKRLPADYTGLFHLDHVALPGPARRGVSRRIDQQPVSHLRRSSSRDRIRKRAMDERRRLPGHSQ